MSQAQGWSLLEVLFSLFLLSYCLLALCQLQLSCFLQTEKNFYTALATSQIYSLNNFLQLNPNADLKVWQEENSILLPEGIGKVIVANQKRIEMTWYDKQKTKPITLTSEVNF